MSEVNCLFVATFFQKQCGRRYKSAVCAMRGHKAKRSRVKPKGKLRADALQQTAPWEAKAAPFATSAGHKKQRASGRKFLHAAYLIKRQERFAPALLYAIAITGNSLSSPAFNTSLVLISSPHFSANSKTTAFISFL